MALYRCAECDTFKDGDYHVCTEDPRDNTQLLCEDCAAEIIEDEE